MAFPFAAQTFRSMLFFVAVTAAMLAPLSASRAADPAPPAAAPEITRVGVVSASSLDALAALARSLGINDLPPFLTAEGLGQQFPFIQPGGIAGDKPVGVVYYASPNMNITSGQGVVIILPVKQGMADLRLFVDQGAQAIPGRNDAATLQGVTFRRSADHLLFGQPAGVVTAVGEADLANQHAADAVAKTPAPVLRIGFDAAAFKKVAPALWQMALMQARVNANAKNPNEQLGQDLVFDYIEKLEQIDLSFSEPGDGNCRVGLFIAPASVPVAHKLPRPGLPADSISRLDVAGTMDDLTPVLVRFGEKLLQNDTEGRLNAEQQAAVSKFFSKAGELVFSGEALSGASLAGEHETLITYYVQQHAKPVDLHAKVQDMAAAADQLLKVDPANPMTVQTSQLQKDGKTIERVVLSSQGKVTLRLDAVQQGNRVYLLTVDADAPDVGDVTSIMNLPDNGEMTSYVSCVIRTDAILDKMAKDPTTDFAKMPQEDREIMNSLTKGQVLRITADPKGDRGLLLNLDVPEKLVKGIVELVAEEGPRHAPPQLQVLPPDEQQ